MHNEMRLCFQAQTFINNAYIYFGELESVVEVKDSRSITTYKSATWNIHCTY